MGYEQMENGGPFRFLAAAVSGQSHQREQGHWQRATPDQQSDQYRLENGSQHLAAEQNLSGSTIPSIQNQLGGHGLDGDGDRKSTRLNSSHGSISYAVFCLKKT